MAKTLSELALGTWSGATAYTVGDIVDNDGSSYVCIANSTNNEPPNATYWALLASIGATGATGSTGATGAAGADGDNAYVYIAYASADDGTGFTTTFNASLDYIAVKNSTTEIVSPAVGDFAGLWKNYKGATGATGPAGSGNVSKVGTPVDNQVGVWTGDGTIEGDTALTFDTATDTLATTNITATAVNKLTLTAPATSATLTIADGKTLTASNTITLAGTDGTTMTFPSTNATIARTDAANTFTGVQTMTSPAITTATLTGAQQLAENASIALDPAGSADGKYSGITVTGTAGYTQAFGDLVYLASADSRWEAADADAATTADRMLAMVVSAGTDGTACTLLLQGIIRADAKFPALTIGSAVYVGETAGEIQVAIPTGADNVIRRVGYALTADEIYFAPSMDSQVSVA